MTATFTLKIAKDTWLTLSKSQSADLPDDQKHHVLAGESFPLSSYKPDADFLLVILDRDRLSQPNPFGEKLTWYVKAADVQIVKGSPVRPASLPGVAKFFPGKQQTAKKGDTGILKP
ncbi:hypothetical protein [Phormidesmis priestleyi]